MPNVITESQYPERDAEIIECVAASSTKEAAEHFGLSVGTIRKIVRREKNGQIYSLALTDGMQTVPIGEVKTSQGFIHACKCAMRKYSGTFSRLELPQWRLVAGDDSVSLGSELLNA